MTKIALADDSGILRSALKNVLESSGFEVVLEAENSKELFDGLKRCPADLILLDVFFPNESGLDMLVKIKASYPQTKVLVVTGLRQDNVLAEAQKNGADGVLYKPFDSSELVAAIERVILKK